MTLRMTLLGAVSALAFSAGAAAAMPAVAQTDLNVRSGPGPGYSVIGAIPGGATVDVAGCTGSWCQVNFAGSTGYASRNYLAMGGDAGPSAAAVAPVDPGYADNGDYYDDGYAYGPGLGVYVSPGYRGGYRRQDWNGRAGWQGRPNNGNWQGRANTGNWQGRANTNWQGRGGPGAVGNVPRGSGFAGPPANWQRPGSGIGPQGGTRSAPAGMPRGAAPAGRAAAPSGGSGFGPPLAR
jgi:hypothetical protein